MVPDLDTTREDGKTSEAAGRLGRFGQPFVSLPVEGPAGGWGYKEAAA